MNRRISKSLKTWAVGLVLTAILQAGFAAEEEPKPAGGIRTDFGDVLIENLGIGRSYNLRELAGTPLKVTNTGAWTIDLQIDVQIPDAKLITQNRIDQGYKAIPAIDWVSLSKSQFVLPSGESAYTDVIITIPNDPALYGKKFQASIYSRSVDKRFLNLGVWSHLFINMVQSPEAQKKIEENRKRGIVENMEYTLIPDKLIILNASIGRRLDIQKELKKTIKLANSGAAPVELTLKVVPVGNTPLTLQQGYVEPKDINWLKPKANIFTVDPDSFVDPGLILDLPNDPSLHQKKLMFVIKVDLANPDITGVTYYGKIYVEVN